MGGRGASSGTSRLGHKYGTDYRARLTAGNVKFVEKTSSESETIMETMTRGRVYVTIGANDTLQSVFYFDTGGKRIKQIDLRHVHTMKRGGVKVKLMPHTHHGYEHDKKATTRLTDRERRLVARVAKIWDDYLGR